MSDFFKIGFGLGFLAGIAVAFMIDFAFRDYLGGTWFDALAYDLSRLMGIPVSRDSYLVFFGVIVIFIFLGLVSGLLGGVVGVFIYKFLKSFEEE